ncbi:DUF4198 domain-containing protein [Algicella marina]|uniref:DUF4198 domain-containing protein n=1 Tax=Algicella marina TaxID=2683284 RepID=A0A6P1T3T0_9RHOB|nr:DUF4198 domain-containing protein [Algicella marina]QHQ36405.1 DUF4198 domain-containing protein [Algicella marina]
MIRTLATALVLAGGPAFAHFGMVIPSDNMVTQEEGRSIDFTVAFSHPFEPLGMELVMPESFKVYTGEGEEDLTETLQAEEFFGAPGYTASYELSRPGAYAFVMTPQPYWEPAEDSYIIHYTKTYIAAFDDDEGWDAELGLKTEIVPLSKPFGLWAGNIFQGIVKFDGKPVPYAEVEVEYYNETGAKAPNELMITQTIKADGNGVFSYAAPVSGWWGFAALKTASYSLPHEDTAKPVELGAVIWVKFEDWIAQ